MAKQCFVKPGSAPPVCGVHNVQLIKNQLPNEIIPFGYQGMTFFVCPVTDAVLDDEAKRE